MVKDTTASNFSNLSDHVCGIYDLPYNNPAFKLNDSSFIIAISVRPSLNSKITDFTKITKIFY